MKEELLKILEIFKEIPLKRIFLFTGIFFMTFSFIQYDKGWILSNNFSIIRLIIGLCFISLFIISLIRSNPERISEIKITSKGKKYTYCDAEITVQIGNIEDKNLYTEKSVVVLPANTKFNDDCITDKKSALGSFFTTHYIDKLEEIKELLIRLAEQECTMVNENEFEMGSTILLPELFNKFTTVAVSAVTKRQEGSGISTDLCAVSLTIKNIFASTADKKIDTIILPVLGSGHGGLAIDFAINTILFNIKYYVQHYHHIKKVKIIIYNENKKPKKIKVLDWRHI